MRNENDAVELYQEPRFILKYGSKKSLQKETFTRPQN